MEPNRVFLGLLRRRQCLVPTLRGWLVLALSFGAVAFVGVLGIGPFLAVTDSVPGGVLVVEGWVPDYMLEAAIAEFKQHHYDQVVCDRHPIAAGRSLV